MKHAFRYYYRSSRATKNYGRWDLWVSNPICRHVSIMWYVWLIGKYELQCHIIWKYLILYNLCEFRELPHCRYVSPNRAMDVLCIQRTRSLLSLCLEITWYQTVIAHQLVQWCLNVLHDVFKIPLTIRYSVCALPDQTVFFKISYRLSENLHAEVDINISVRRNHLTRCLSTQMAG